MNFSLQKKITSYIIIALLLIASIEIFLRILKIEYPIFQKHDEIRGFALLPNSKGNWTREGRGFVEINSDGLRDVEHNLKKPNDVYRIAILGDSFAEARSVNLEDTFWFKLKSNLKNCRNKKFKNLEIINFGITEYGTTQQYLTLKNNVWKYEPDLILLAFFSENDVADNSKKLSLKKYRPYYVVKNGDLVLDNSFKTSKPYKILSSIPGKIFIRISQYSIIAQLFIEAYVQSYFKFLKKKEKNKMKKTFNEQEIENSNLYNPSDKNWSEAWLITEKIIKLINDDVKSKKKDFILISLSTPMQVHPNHKMIDKYLTMHKIKDIHYPDKRLQKFSIENNIKYINTAKKLELIAKKNNTFFHGFKNTKLGSGHWNETGHDIASKIISSKICKLY